MKTDFVLGFLAGAAGGMGAMYLFDPKMGNKRRALIRDKGVHYSHKVQDATEKAYRDLRNRGKGVLHDAKKAVIEKTHELKRAV